MELATESACCAFLGPRLLYDMFEDCMRAMYLYKSIVLRTSHFVHLRTLIVRIEEAFLKQDVMKRETVD